MSTICDTRPTDKLYSSKIIKAGALLTDTKILLSNWDEIQSVSENLQRFKQENIFGKASRSRVEDILPIFRQRYLVSEDVIGALSILARSNFPTEAFNRILYFHATQSDSLLFAVVTEVLAPLQANGRIDISSSDIKRAVIKWVEEGKTNGNWTENTITRATRSLMATLRDFGVLQGAANKKLAPVYLPLEAFAYIALYLKKIQPSGVRLINDPEWQLFFFSPNNVERLFIEAHQHRLLEYYAAGSIIRITFPTESLKEYAHVITERPS